MTYTKDPRPIVSKNAWCNSSAPGNWNGLHPDIVPPHDAEFIYGKMMATMPTTDRVLFWQMGGRNSGTLLTFGVAQLIPTETTNALIRCVETWKGAKANREVQFYGGWGSDPFCRDITAYGFGSKRWWHQHLLPLVGLFGCDSIGLDAGNLDWNAVKQITSLVGNEYGMRPPYVEAMPVVQTLSNPGMWVPDLPRMKANPSITWWSNFAGNPVYAQWRKWAPLPAEVESHILLMPASSGYPAPTQADVDELTSKGFVVGWNDGEFKL